MRGKGKGRAPGAADQPKEHPHRGPGPAKPLQLSSVTLNYSFLLL